MRVAINGWFAGREVGSGQYTDRLVAALRADAALDDDFALVPRRPGGPIAKTWYEQVIFPTRARHSDVLHVPYWGPPLWARQPLVVTVHDLIPLLLPEYRERWLVRVYARLAAAGSQRACQLIADSSFTAQGILAHLGVEPERVTVVPLAADPACTPHAETGSVRQRFGLPDRFGLYLGGFDRRKNLPTLLAAWRLVHEATGCPLVVAGRIRDEPSGLYRDPRHVATEVGLAPAALRCLGFVPEADKPGLLAAATVFAYPSRYEGFGLPPLEAMACGTPAVVADATSLPEVVGDAAIRVPPEDVAAWSEALLAVLRDAALARALRARGLERASAYSWSTTAALTRRIYERAIASGRPRGCPA